MAPSPELLAFAEDPSTVLPVGEEGERILTARYCLTFSPGGHYWSTSVEHLRFGPADDDVLAGVGEIRGLIAARGRDAAAWQVGPSSTPKGLADALRELGMDSEPGEGSLVLVLTEPPRAGASSFEVRLVSTLEDHVAAVRVANEAFGHPSEDAELDLLRAKEAFDAERRDTSRLRMLVLDGGRPIASGRAEASPVGIHLGGGATIPSDRRRGAMTAMVRAAWDEAVRRGTPALATWAGELSAPALQRLGFRAHGRIRHLIDRLPASAHGRPV